MINSPAKRNKRKLPLIFVFTAVIACAFVCASASFGRAYGNVVPPTLISVEYGKVLKNGVQKVELYGTYNNKGLFAENVTIVVSNAKTGKEITRFSPSVNGGYNPAVTLTDFTGDGIKEIFLGMDSGGSGAFTFNYVYELSGGQAKAIFDFETVKNNYTAKYADFYKVTVKDEDTTFTVDISGRDADYLNKIYNPDGTLIKELSAEVSQVNTVLPYFSSNENKYNLIILRRITGLFSADSFGYTQDFMSFDGTDFSVFYRTVSINPDANNMMLPD